MPSPSPPPPNALGGCWPPKIILKRGADGNWTFKVRYEVRTEAPPIEQRKVQAKRARPEAAREESQMIPNYGTDGQYAAEQAHADCVPPPPAKRHCRHIRGSSERYRNSETEAHDPPSASKGKSLSTENRSASSMEIPMPCETRSMRGQQPDAGQSLSMAKTITFSLALTKEEVIEDFAAMRLPLPMRRPRKVLKSQFKHLFPGSGLPKALTPGRYIVKGRGNC